MNLPERGHGHKDPSIALCVYTQWLPDASTVKFVDVLDDESPRGTQTAPAPASEVDQNALSRLGRMVTLTFASWNHLTSWLKQIEGLRTAA